MRLNYPVEYLEELETMKFKDFTGIHFNANANHG